MKVKSVTRSYINLIRFNEPWSGVTVTLHFTQLLRIGKFH